jgi:hypothetical protein
MYSTCLHCNKPLGSNEVIETLPIGRRIAFDASQGRLWVVCRHCAKWNLVPFDTRLETIDSCERIYCDTATRYSTGTIGLARTREGLDLVRIGEALRPEFAAWRYGESYRRRRRNSYLVGGLALAGVGGGVALLGAAGVALGSFMGMAHMVGTNVWNAAIARRARFMVDDPEGQVPLQVDRDMGRKSVITWEDQGPTLKIPVPEPGVRRVRIAQWRGTDMRAVGRRVTGGMNLLSGTSKELASATELLAGYKGMLEPWMRTRAEVQRQAGDQAEYWDEAKRKPKTGAKPGSKSASGKPHWLGYSQPFLITARLAADERLAVEMWMNEDIERTWLSGELRLLEREWKNAEKLAKIADDLVLPEVNAGEG